MNENTAKHRGFADYARDHREREELLITFTIPDGTGKHRADS